MKLPAKKPGRSPSVNAAFSQLTRFLYTRLIHHTVIVNAPMDAAGRFQRIILSIMHGKGTNVAIDLTHLTLAELIAFRETVAIATEVAEPIVRQRDLEAQEKAENGDDSDDRIYRAVPTVVVRERALNSYNESVLNGRPDVFQRVGPGNGRLGRSSDGGSAVDERKQEDGGTQDEPPQAY